MADKVGANFAARISGVTRFGLFVTVAESGASGIVPVRVAAGRFLACTTKGTQTLTGRRTRLAFRLAQEVEVRLAEASPVTGGLVFHILQGVPATVAAARGRRASDRGSQVIRIGVLLLLLLVVPAHAQTVAARRRIRRRASSAEVYATALAFMAPRTLEPVAVSQLTLWGLRGLTALDPQLDRRAARTAGCGSLRGTASLSRGRRRRTSDTTAGRPPRPSLPPPRAASRRRSAAPARQGIVQSFFDELFNHLDPYSRYVPPAEPARTASAARPGRRRIALARRGAAVVGGGGDHRRPAARWPASGPATRILAVDGQSTRGKDAATVRGWIAGPEGTQRHHHLARPRRTAAHGRTGRAMVPPETVFAQRIGDVLVLQVTAFNRSTDCASAPRRSSRASPGPRPPGRHRAGPARQSRRAAAPGGRGGRQPAAGRASWR